MRPGSSCNTKASHIALLGSGILSKSIYLHMMYFGTLITLKGGRKDWEIMDLSSKAREKF